MTISATVIFDNGGGTTLQLSDGESSYAHYYDDAAIAAGDLREAFSNGFGSFDGNEPDAEECAPTDDEIRNGGYKVARFDSVSEMDDFANSEFESSWFNAREFARDHLKRIL